MLNYQLSSNKLLLSGIKQRNYELIHKALQSGGAIYDKTQESSQLFFKSWNNIIELEDIGIIEHIYNAYEFKNLHTFQHLLVSIILNKKDCFDFFLKQCINKKIDLNYKHGILLSNSCKISPFSTYEEDFTKYYNSDYFITKLLNQHIDLNATSKHPLILLAENNNFHSWKILFNHIKSQDNYRYEQFEKTIVHSLYAFLDNNSFLSEEVQYFFSNFDKKNMFSYGLKKISNSSYKGKDLSTFCLEMFSQEPELFLKRCKQLGKNNEFFLQQIEKIHLFHKLNDKLKEKPQTNKVIKI